MSRCRFLPVYLSKIACFLFHSLKLFSFPLVLLSDARDVLKISWKSVLFSRKFDYAAFFIKVVSVTNYQMSVFPRSINQRLQVLVTNRVFSVSFPKFAVFCWLPLASVQPLNVEDLSINVNRNSALCPKFLLSRPSPLCYTCESSKASI